MNVLIKRSQDVGGQTGPPHLSHLLLLLLHPVAQSLNLRKQHHHQRQVLVYALLQRALVRQAQPHLGGLLLQVLVLESQPVDLPTQVVVLS
jgi:hypothetical protein